MKVTGITSTAMLFLLLGLAAPAHAQQDQQGEKQDHPRQQQGKSKQAKPKQQKGQQQQQSDQRERQPRPAHQQQPQPAQQQQRQVPNDRQAHNQDQRGNEQRQHSQEPQHVRESAWQQHRARSWQTDHRTWEQRGGYHGYRVAADPYRRYFGPEHGFRVNGLPFLVVGGYPRFQYSGYWVSLVDPWPEYWANDWYDTDDVYVSNVNNGYYLFNRRHPGPGIAIRISM